MLIVAVLTVLAVLPTHLVVYLLCLHETLAMQEVFCMPGGSGCSIMSVSHLPPDFVTSGTFGMSNKPVIV